MNLENRTKIIECARECVGTPFRHQGRTPGYGMDCVGLIRHPMVVLGFYPECADFRGYGPFPRPIEMARILSEYLDAIEGSNLVPGDVLWMNAPQPQHLALYTGHTIIHAVQNGPGRVVEHGYRSPFPSRTVGYFRYRGVD